MKHWHKCVRWTRRGLACPYVGPIHDDILDDDEDDDDQDDDDQTIDKLPVPARKTAKTPTKQFIQKQAEGILKESEAWNQAPLPVPKVGPVLPPAVSVPYLPGPKVQAAPVPQYATQLFPPAATSIPEGGYKAGAQVSPGAVMAPLMQQGFDALYKAGNPKLATAPSTLAKGLQKTPAPTLPTYYPTPYYSKGPELQLKPALATIESQLSTAVATYKPISQPSALKKFTTKIEPLSPYLLGAAGIAGAGGFFFNWAGRLNSMFGAP